MAVQAKASFNERSNDFKWIDAKIELIFNKVKCPLVVVKA